MFDLMKRTAGAAMVLGLTVSAALAGPVGTYRVEGKSTDGSTYSGTATVVATGQTFKVTWVVGSDRYVGTAVGNDDFFAVSFASGGITGVAAL